jgi:hypothetical protein
MKQDNPFAKLGALDQKLYQDTAPKPVHNVPVKATDHSVDREVGTKLATESLEKKPANLQTRKPATSPAPTLNTIEKVEKYSTRLKPSLIKGLQLYAIEHDIKNDYDVVQAALIEYLNKNK